MTEGLVALNLPLDRAQACAREVFCEPGPLEAIAFARRLIDTPERHLDPDLDACQRTIQEADLVDLMFRLHAHLGCVQRDVRAINLLVVETLQASLCTSSGNLLTATAFPE